MRNHYIKIKYIQPLTI